MKSRPDSNDFYAGADDYAFYMSATSHYLDSVKCKTLTRESKGNTVFRTQSGKVYQLNLNDLYWGAILFNGKDRPIKADITDIEFDYKPYMK